MQKKSASYELYREACKKYRAEPVSAEEYNSVVESACTRLKDMEITVNKCPYICYNINRVVVKFKRIDDENVEVNFFSKDQFKDIISKYKEE